MPSSWLLIETLDPGSPTVVAQGGAVKSMVPIDAFFKRSAAKDALAAVISRVCTSSRAQKVGIPGNKVAIAEPVCDDWKRVHGVWLRTVDAADAASSPPHGRAWAFVWNLTRGTVTRSKGLVPEGSEEEAERREWTIAEAFNVLETGSDASETLVKIINAAPGTKHQTTWPQKRPDGTRHDVNFAVRIFSEPPPDGPQEPPERILRGLSHDLGLARPAVDSESPIMLAELVAATSAEPGEYRAILELHPLRLLRWYGEPFPDLAWEFEEYQRIGKPPVHPDDREVVRRMQRDLDSGRAFGVVRLLTRRGDYLAVEVVAKLIILNRSTTAALVTFRDA
ncbi:GAF domain-containing protein [Nocardia sp. NPDC004068]|uniref:GAF domain-containing protein n=1 Tax=Nocardia sp. NPDC004068 TaxID=3364303 RepID=UPI00368EFFA5